jgi:hypothetical protein
MASLKTNLGRDFKFYFGELLSIGDQLFHQLQLLRIQATRSNIQRHLCLSRGNYLNFLPCLFAKIYANQKTQSQRQRV